MERKLLGVYESERAIVRLYSGDKTKSLDDLKEAMQEPAIEFAKAVISKNSILLDHLRKIAAEK